MEISLLDLTEIKAFHVFLFNPNVGKQDGTTLNFILPLGVSKKYDTGIDWTCIAPPMWEDVLDPCIY
jgi:hypothetical protein